MKRVLSHYGLLGVVLLLATAGGVNAQEFRATIRGQVLDTSGGALPGTVVTVTNVETNEVATATTNTEGNYTILFLRPGAYTLTAELSGFQKYVRSGLQLQVGQDARFIVQLGVCDLTLLVSVTD